MLLKIMLQFAYKAQISQRYSLETMFRFIFAAIQKTKTSKNMTNLLM